MHSYRDGPGRRPLELTRPELVWTQRRGRRGDDDRDNPPRQQHWRFIDVVAMIFAALQVILPIGLLILAGAGAAYLLFMLVFG